jgi:hypothetical protein
METQRIKAKRTRITVRNNAGQEFEMPALQLGPLAVHKPIPSEKFRRGWVLTHIPTGRSVQVDAMDLRTQASAKHYAAALQSLEWPTGTKRGTKALYEAVLATVDLCNICTEARKAGGAPERCPACGNREEG